MPALVAAAVIPPTLRIVSLWGKRDRWDVALLHRLPWSSCLCAAVCAPRPVLPASADGGGWALERTNQSPSLGHFCAERRSSW